MSNSSFSLLVFSPRNGGAECIPFAGQSVRTVAPSGRAKPLPDPRSIHTALRGALCARRASLAACLFRARPFITHMTILADGNCLYPVIRTISYAGPLSPTFTIIPRFPAIVASCLERRIGRDIQKNIINRLEFLNKKCKFLNVWIIIIVIMMMMNFFLWKNILKNPSRFP